MSRHSLPTANLMRQGNGRTRKVNLVLASGLVYRMGGTSRRDCELRSKRSKPFERILVCRLSSAMRVASAISALLASRASSCCCRSLRRIFFSSCRFARRSSCSCFCRNLFSCILTAKKREYRI